MRQKIVMAAALIHEPKLIVLDEPLVGLDPRSLKVFKDVLKQKAASGTTIFFSTHALYIAQELCERLAIISRGRLVAEGTLEELREREDLDLESTFLRITQNSTQPEMGE
jgi:ABC-2 type transport system ATP-binding protein